MSKDLKATLYVSKSDPLLAPDRRFYYKCHACAFPIVGALSTGCPKCKAGKYVRITRDEYNQLRKDWGPK